ncbi:MAG: ankyrin repeat domain-containing protein [Arcobacteraceae bacterium]|nr:ankyrin repeat domain-containing protein [Arcobacteraceae bacterium]
MEELKAWCESGADVDFQNHMGFSALMASAQKGDLKVVKLLIEYGAHLNLKDKNKFSALYYATLNNHLDVVKYLVNNGARLNDEIYMTAILKDFKKISLYFDSLDIAKQILTTK